MKRQRAATHAAPSAQLTDGWGLLRPSAQARIQTIAGMSDCSIRVGTTVFGSLHRLKLAEASAVLRGMIESVADSSTIVLHDDTPEQVALAIALIYEPFMGSLTDDTVGDALTLSIKYDMADVLHAATAHVMRAELTVDTFLHWLPLAAAQELQPAVDRCLAFARTGDNLHDIMERYEDTWMQRLPAAVLTQLLAPQLRLESAARRAMVDSLNWSMGSAVKPLGGTGDGAPEGSGDAALQPRGRLRPLAAASVACRMRGYRRRCHGGWQNTDPNLSAPPESSGGTDAGAAADLPPGGSTGSAGSDTGSWEAKREGLIAALQLTPDQTAAILLARDAFEQAQRRTVRERNQLVKVLHAFAVGRSSDEGEAVAASAALRANIFEEGRSLKSMQVWSIYEALSPWQFAQATVLSYPRMLEGIQLADELRVASGARREATRRTWVAGAIPEGDVRDVRCDGKNVR